MQSLMVLELILTRTGLLMIYLGSGPNFPLSLLLKLNHLVSLSIFSKETSKVQFSLLFPSKEKKNIW